MDPIKTAKGAKSANNSQTETRDVLSGKPTVKMVKIKRKET
jgi:hypothetical protein